MVAPNPKFVLAPPTVVALLPPLLIETIPVILAAVRFVNAPPLLEAKLDKAREDGWNADAGFVAAVPRPRPLRALVTSALQKLVGLCTTPLVLTMTLRVWANPETARARKAMVVRIDFIITFVVSTPWY